MSTYKKHSGWPHFAQFWCNVSPFRINTCKTVSKQRTLTPFRMSTYEKTGGGEGGERMSVPPLLPVFRRFFQVPYDVTPLFATLTKTAGGCTLSSLNGTSESHWKNYR